MSKRSRSEYKAIRILEAAGYYCIRATASLGLFDVVAINRQRVRWIIQVKTNRSVSPTEREAIALFESPANSSKEIWIFKDRARNPIIKEIN